MNFIERLKRLLGAAEARREEAGEPTACTGTDAITCMEALEKLYEYLDGELEGVSGEQVSRHLEICKCCFPHLQLEKSFREAVLRVQTGEVCPEEVKQRVMDSLMAEGFTSSR
jgi:anti-sigma factor (TIGR02949 family)